MAIEVTEMWSPMRAALRSSLSAVRAFEVSGTTSQAAALTATGTTSGIAIPQRGDPHDEYPDALFCDGPAVVERKGPQYFVVQCTYSPEGGATTETNPLNQPVSWIWTPIELSEQVDIDLDKHPITNSVGETVTDTRDLTIMRLTVWRNDPTYVPSTARLYIKAVNDAAISTGSGTVDAGHVCCVSFRPTTELNANSPYSRNEYVFDFVFGDELGTEPFQHRIIDESLNGWWDDGGVKRLARWSDGKGNLLDGPVKLDGDGFPLASKYDWVKVGPGNKDPVAPPIASAEFGGEMLTSGGNDLAWAMFYRKKKEVDFSAFGFFTTVTL